MRIDFLTDEQDVQRLKTLMKDQSSNAYVIHRQRLLEESPTLDRNQAWKTLVMCILSSASRWTAVDAFLKSSDNVLGLDTAQASFERLADRLRNSRIRFPLNKANQIALAHEFLQRTSWSDLVDASQHLADARRMIKAEAIEIERAECQRTARWFKGIGNKQARNFWINMGFLRYEIPLDSRWDNWLVYSGFPITYSASVLQDAGIYFLIESGIQALCEKADVVPALADAAVFASNTPK